MSSSRFHSPGSSMSQACPYIYISANVYPYPHTHAPSVSLIGGHIPCPVSLCAILAECWPFNHLCCRSVGVVTDKCPKFETLNSSLSSMLSESKQSVWSVGQRLPTGLGAESSDDEPGLEISSDLPLFQQNVRRCDKDWLFGAHVAVCVRIV